MTVDETETEPPAEPGLILDEVSQRLESLALLRGGDSSALLESFGTTGKVEEDMLEQLSGPVLAHPDRFEQAHRTAMRAMEVYDRNASRKPTGMKDVPKPLKGVVGTIIQWMVRYIVRKHQKALAYRIRQMYAMREANAPSASRERVMLMKARRQVDEINSFLQKNELPLPAFLGVGAIVSGTLSTVKSGLASDLGRILVLAGFAILGLAFFWCVLRAAGIARHRTRIALDAPLQALWEVIGDLGGIPKDQSRKFATYGTFVLIAVWVVVPVLVLLVWRNV